MIPITRIDEYLAVISQDEDATGLPDQAITRIDTYLSKIAGEAVAELPEPVTRIDRYLASIAGMDVVMDDPITRIDYYLATVAGVYSGELPEPVTRIDHYLYNWANGGGMPDWTVFTGNPLQFNAPKAHTLKSVKVEFSPIQDLHGQASPYPAGGGKQLCPYQDKTATSAGLGCTAVFKDNNVKITGTCLTTGGRTTYRTDMFSLKAGTYHLNLFNVANGSNVVVVAQDNSTILARDADGKFTLGADTNNFNIGFNLSTADVTYNYSADIMLSVEKETSFAPYANECPITGWSAGTVDISGENLAEKQTGYNSQGGTIESTYISTTSDTAIISSLIAVKPNTAYVIKREKSGGMFRWFFFDREPVINETTAIGGYYSNQSNTESAITTPANAKYMFVLWTRDQDCGNVQVNLGSTASPYSTHTGRKISVTWTDEAGTVYGGYLLFYEDGSVDLVGDVANVVLTGSEQYILSGTTVVIRTNPDIAGDWDKRADILCNYEKNPDVGFASNSATRLQFRYVDTHWGVTTADAFQAKMEELYNGGNPVHICYPLANPVTYHLPSLEEAIRCFPGINVVWSDMNENMEVEARANSVQLNALQSLNMLLGGRYYNNGTADEPTDEEALRILMGGER